MEDLHQELIRIIDEKTPPGMNVVDFFTELIPMSKSAAYKRLRGEIPLTLKEAASIAGQLNISLDNLIKFKQEDVYAVSIVRMKNGDLASAYCKTENQIVEALRFLQTNSDACIYASTQSLPELYIFNYPTISKFRFFKYTYQCRQETLPPKMSDIVIPENVRSMEIAHAEELQKIPIYFIWAKELFIPYIVDVLYFFEIGLLSIQEVRLLTEETYALLDELERDTMHGKMKSGVPLQVYLSNTYFDSNYIYIEGGGYKACSTNVFGMNYYSSTEPELCVTTKEWIESLMKYSVLISNCGAVERTEFFRQQRKLIEKLNI
jgi:hypothetical protein